MSRSFRASNGCKQAAPWKIRTMAPRRLARTRCQERQPLVEGLLYAFTLKALMHGIFITVHYQSFTLDANIAGQKLCVKKYLMPHNFV